MKILTFALLLFSSSVFASQSLDCSFDGGAYILKAHLNSNKSLSISKIDGEAITGGPESESKINNNPVPRELSRGGRSRYFIDALSSDSDYGNTYVLYLPQQPKNGTNAASLSYTYNSREPADSRYVEGHCELQKRPN